MSKDSGFFKEGLKSNDEQIGQLIQFADETSTILEQEIDERKEGNRKLKASYAFLKEIGLSLSALVGTGLLYFLAMHIVFFLI